MFLYTFFQTELQVVNWDSCYMLTECANELVLAAECAEPHTRRWLETQLSLTFPQLVGTSQFTEQTYVALQHDMHCASTAVRVNVFFEFHSSVVCELKTPL
jgi:hypothetical protein